MSTSATGESALTAGNRSVERRGDGRLPALRQRRERGAALLFLQHFGAISTRGIPRSSTASLGARVILLDNRGVGASTGAVPTTSKTWPATCCASSMHSG